MEFERPRDVVQYLFAPLAPSEFVEHYLEQRPLHMSGRSPGYYERWLTLPAFFRIIGCVDPTWIRLQALRQPENPGNTDAISLQAALDAYRTGSTLVANSLHRVHAPMAILCRQLEIFFHQPFQVNVYATPPGTQGFKAHYDDHDVLVCQVAGRKRWKVYAPKVELPLPEQNFPVTVASSVPPLLDIELQAGDLLYLPRGYIHMALAQDEGPSLHLTYGLMAITWRDVAARALANAALRCVDLRRLARLDGAGDTSRLAAGMLDGDPVADAWEHFVLSREAVLPDIPMVPVLTPESRLERHPLVLACVRERDGEVKVSFHGKTLGFPLGLGPVLRFMVTQEEPYQVRDIPASTNWLRIHLAGLLCREGLLRCRD